MSDTNLKTTFSLDLFHGRWLPEQDMDDWGFQGPVLRGITSISITYLHHWRIEFKDRESYDAALEATGWEEWDELILSTMVGSDMLHVSPAVGSEAWFGDWSMRTEA